MVGVRVVLELHKADDLTDRRGDPLAGVDQNKVLTVLCAADRSCGSVHIYIQTSRFGPAK